MPVSDANYFVFPDKGGLQRDYVDLHDHRMPGASDENLLAKFGDAFEPGCSARTIS